MCVRVNQIHYLAASSLDKLWQVLVISAFTTRISKQSRQSIAKVIRHIVALTHGLALK